MVFAGIVFAAVVRVLRGPWIRAFFVGALYGILLPFIPLTTVVFTPLLMVFPPLLPFSTTLINGLVLAVLGYFVVKLSLIKTLIAVLIFLLVLEFSLAYLPLPPFIIPLPV
jgi:hypothetical protein